jgi:hypothetical protein
MRKCSLFRFFFSSFNSKNVKVAKENGLTDKNVHFMEKHEFFMLVMGDFSTNQIYYIFSLCNHIAKQKKQLYLKKFQKFIIQILDEVFQHQLTFSPSYPLSKTNHFRPV